MKSFLIKYGKHLLALVIFLLITSIYFAPTVFHKQHLSQADNIKYEGTGGKEMSKYAAQSEEKEFSIWSDSMFGGMPYIHSYGSPAPSLPSFKMIGNLAKKLSVLDASTILTGMICFYILMWVMGMSFWLSIMGSIAFALSSYNIIIIEAGHVTKAYVIAFMPLTLAGLKLLFDKKYLWGATIFTMGVAFSISNLHLQITYYLFILCVFIFLGFIISCIKAKNFKHLYTVTAICAASVIIAVMTDASYMYSQWDMSKHSTRGPSELSQNISKGPVEDSSNTDDTKKKTPKKSKGLERDYAFEYSYGKMETMTLLIPNLYGGESLSDLPEKCALVEAGKKNNVSITEQIPSYWGEKAQTAGPVYFGAVICFLFILGMFVIDNRMKWWLFAAALFGTMLAWGKYFAIFNNLMFEILPLYTKFRTVEMALVIPEVIFPIVGIWGLKEIFSGNADTRRIKQGMITSSAICGGLCIILILFSGFIFDFSGSVDNNIKIAWYLDALRETRHQLLVSDSYRSLALIIATALILLGWQWKRNKWKYSSIIAQLLLTILVLADLWTVDRRFISDKNFKQESSSQTYSISEADSSILKDTDLSYRVFTVNDPFSDTKVSNYHHSIGGYHAAKIRRYDELISHKLVNEYKILIDGLNNSRTHDALYPYLSRCTAMNMLNTKYIIYNENSIPVTNPYALGNAWFVKNYTLVDNPDQELEALNTVNPATTAIIDKRFSKYVEGWDIQSDSRAKITLTEYKPGKLKYHSKSNTLQIAVFSEIYYKPGWRVSIDGKAYDHFRADWILRAMLVPSGEHDIVFEFKPSGYVVGEYIASFSSFIILLLLIGLVCWSIWDNLLKEYFLNKKQ